MQMCIHYTYHENVYLVYSVQPWLYAGLLFYKIMIIIVKIMNIIS